MWFRLQRVEINTLKYDFFFSDNFLKIFDVSTRVLFFYSDSVLCMGVSCLKDKCLLS